MDNWRKPHRARRREILKVDASDSEVDERAEPNKRMAFLRDIRHRTKSMLLAIATGQQAVQWVVSWGIVHRELSGIESMGIISLATYLSQNGPTNSADEARNYRPRIDLHREFSEEHYRRWQVAPRPSSTTVFPIVQSQRCWQVLHPRTQTTRD